MKSKKSLLVLTSAFLATVALVGCGGQKAKVTNVTIANAAELEVDYQGTLQLAAKVEGTGKFDETVTWSVPAGATTARVDEGGLMTNLTEQDAYITVTATANGDKTKSATATVKLWGKAEIYGLEAKLDSIFVLGVEEKESQQMSVEFDGNGKYNADLVFTSSDEEVATVDLTGLVTAKQVGHATITATAVGDSSKKDSVDIEVLQAANGPRNFKRLSYDEKTNVLGALEKYASETHLTGLSLYGDGGYVMYADGVVKGTNNYIPGYGFGILTEGNITEDLAGESNPAWKRYYHTYETDDPQNLLYMNDKGAVVGDLIAYCSNSYWDTKMNATKDGYEWVNSLAKSNRPIAVDPDEGGFAKTWKFPVKVGGELKYNTNTSVERLAAYNGREVALEDYITPYKIYYTQAFGLARTSENLSGSGSIKGAKAYVAASKSNLDEEAFKKVGIRAYVDELDGESYLEFEFNNECDQFYAMYYLSSGMFQPVPMDFILACGGANNEDIKKGVAAWGVSSTDGKENPSDHFLSTGPYTIERWDNDDQIVFKKNPYYQSEVGAYNIPGVHINIFPAAKDDTEAAFREFLDGKLTGAGIPFTRLAEFRDDPRTTITASSSNYKLNINSCDEETWEELFGENGTIEQTAKADYWNLKPAMHNTNFVDGISFATDRKTIADKLGRSYAATYFSDNYLSDPANGVSYNSTQAHKDAVAKMLEGTDGFGYSFEQAVASFKKAGKELIDNGDYAIGDTIEIEVAWQTNAQIDQTHNDLAKMWEDAFNAAGTGLKLKVTWHVGAVWSDVYYKKMMVGQYDIAFGSISGNSLDPLNFMEVLKSDNSSGFTLNWGLDTGAVDGKLVYEGEAYSFDALWQAGDTGTFVENGANSALIPEFLDWDAEYVENGALTVYVLFERNIYDETTYGFVSSIYLFAYNADASGARDSYKEIQSDSAEYEYIGLVEDEEGVISEDAWLGIFTFDAVSIEMWFAAGYASDQLWQYGQYGPYQGFDVYYAMNLNGSLSAEAIFDTFAMFFALEDFIVPVEAE